MKKILTILLLFFLLLLPNNVSAKEQVNIYLFYSSTCPHCKQEKTFLSELENRYDNLKIRMYEVSSEKNNTLFEKVKKEFNSETIYVPFTAIGDKYWVGFNDNTALKMEEIIKDYSNQKHRDIAGEALGFSYYEEPETPEIPEIEENQKEENVIVPILGTVNPKTISLPLIAAVIGLVDGFNPCAMWILLFLISMLLGTKDKKRMWILGLTFLITSAFVYLLFMLSWLKIAISFTQITWIRLIIAIVALIGAFINLKSYYKSKEAGCHVVDDKKRNKIFDKIKKFTTEKSFLLAILGIIALAFSVNLIELACSAGLPLLFTQVLAMNDLSNSTYFIYMLIYIFFFLLDDIIVFTVAMFTLKMTGITTKYSKYSHLIGGILMLLIGLLLILKPEWLMFNF